MTSHRPLSTNQCSQYANKSSALLYKRILAVLSRTLRDHVQEMLRVVPNLITLLRHLLHAFVVPTIIAPQHRTQGHLSTSKTPWIIAYAPFSADCAAEYARFLEFLVQSRADLIRNNANKHAADPLKPTESVEADHSLSKQQVRGTRAGGITKMLSRYVPYLLAEYCAIQGGAAILHTPAPGDFYVRADIYGGEFALHQPFQGLAWRPMLVLQLLMKTILSCLPAMNRQAH